MSVHLVAFADDSMSYSMELCRESASTHGVDVTHSYSHEENQFRGNRTGVRGLGYWAWKPEVILDVMNPVHDHPIAAAQVGDILIYSDAGVEFINNVSHIIDRMDQDIFLFGNQYEHAHWCKRDIVDEVWPQGWIPKGGNQLEHNLTWYPFGKQVQASVIFFRINDETRAFVKEWLDWCLFEGGRLIDDSPSRTPNHPEFQENRHDQAILTTMAYRDGLKLHWWPASYNDGGFTYPKGEYADDYPVLFNHHRKRNHEWKQVA